MHLGDDLVEGASVVDPFCVELGDVWGDEAADCLALFLPGELVVGAMALGRVFVAPAVGITTSQPTLIEGTCVVNDNYTFPSTTITLPR